MCRYDTRLLVDLLVPLDGSSCSPASNQIKTDDSADAGGPFVAPRAVHGDLWDAASHPRAQVYYTTVHELSFLH